MKAQQEGYFKSINFIPVSEFHEARSDAAIAAKAMTQLEEDLRKGYDHIVMARVRNIDRTDQIFPLYAKYSQYGPVIIHSGLKGKERKATLEKIRDARSRIIICVDMLGEGFDLPELKIAALHDIHKSLGVTLQFTGRFTRTKHNIGEATFIANIADTQVSDVLTDLYGENSDWNKILRVKGAEAIEEQVRLDEFLRGFGTLPSDIPVQNLRPKMSTVIYRMGYKQWNPERFKTALDKDVEATYAIQP